MLDCESCCFQFTLMLIKIAYRNIDSNPILLYKLYLKYQNKTDTSASISVTASVEIIEGLV